MPQNRYNQLLDLVGEVRPKSIIEVGVWNGDRAILMARRALMYNPKVHYAGFDLFEDATAQNDQEELNAKRHNSYRDVGAKLAAFAVSNPGFTFELIKGNTRETLKAGGPGPRVADFAFIDGGHSVETIRTDSAALRNCGYIVWDDYYFPGPGGVDLNKFGANRVVDSDFPGHRVLPSTDALTMGGGGIVALAAWDNRAAYAKTMAA